MKHRRKKTEYNIDRVIGVFKRKTNSCIWVSQQFVTLPSFNYDEIPEGCYTTSNNRLYCPKKRNEKLNVRYYSFHQEEL